MDGMYIKNLLNQVLDSYKMIKELKDKPGDLNIIKEQVGKIQGLLQVIVNKIEKLEDNSDSVTEFLDVAKSYLKDYSFYHEIDTVAKLYSDDSYRIKGIRLVILSALEKSKLITTTDDVLRTL